MTDTPILTHGRVGMSRVGTGCAWPGRLAAVCLKPAGSAPSRTPRTSALCASECEIYEGTALPLLDDHCEQQHRPNARDRDRWRAFDHRFQCRVAHREMSPEDRRDDDDRDEHCAVGEQRLELGLLPR